MLNSSILLWLVLAAVLLALLVVVIRFITAYQAAKGTRWQRFLLVFRNSETILWARVQVFGGALLTASGTILTFASDFLHRDDVSQIMHGLITDTKQLMYYGLGLIGLGSVTEAVRRHRTVPDPVTGAIDTPPPAPKN